MGNNAPKKNVPQPEGKDLLYQLRKVMHSYFPDLGSQLSSLTDERERKHYGNDELLMAAISMFIFKEGSRNAFNNDGQTASFKDNFEKLFDCRLAHMDTVHAYLCALDSLELEEVQLKMVRRLVENKVLERYKIMGYYMIVIDGSGVCSSANDRFGCGLSKTSQNRATTYMYHVLEAKLVTPDGLCIPLAKEWIVNDENHNEAFDKQDCESKAFKRLAVKLKKYFTRLPICILADALYANDPAIGICEQNNWKYIITLQDKSLPCVQDSLKDDPRTLLNSFYYQPSVQNKQITLTQQLYWAEDLRHKKHGLNYIECIETVTHIKTGEQTPCKFARITNFDVGKNNARQLCDAGRLRWKIENEGFNTQKNAGYGMQHLFSRKSFKAWKNYYQCMLIAIIINQLFEKTYMVHDALKANNKLTIKHLCKLMTATLQLVELCAVTIGNILRTKHQIRLAVT